MQLDFAIGFSIFIVSLVIFYSLSYQSFSSINYCYVKSVNYRHFRILRIGRGYEIANNRKSLVYVIIINEKGWSIFRGLTPLFVNATIDDWVIVITLDGYGVKKGNAIGKVYVNIRGVFKDVPSLRPYIVIYGQHYEVYPSEFIKVPSGERSYSELIISGLKLRRIRLIIFNGVLMIECCYG